jgi:muramoyltetrapeptide carboxypeptidase
MSLTKPKALKPGALLGIVSPASIVRAELVEQGIAALHGLGYRTRLFPHALDRGPLNYAGTREDRLADLHAAFADSEVDGIICARGGWGTAELLPYLDAALIRANPKPFLGYSDLTTLHIWLRREADLISFQAPMVASDFAKRGGPESWSPDLASWTAALTRTEPWSLGVESGLRVLRRGTAEGLLAGGCISILAESLGTPYGPDWRGGILFLEDVGTKTYQWDRLLLHLRYAGLMEGVTGIVFGDMRQCCAAAEDALMEATILHALRDFSGPIGIGLRSGHVAGGNITLPFGVGVRLDLDDGANPQMHFVEAAVRD